jgi:hypothetical protein
MSRKLCIVMGDDNSVQVGLEPAEMGGMPPMGDGASPEGDDTYLEPVDSLDAAFERGRALLMEGTEDEAAEKEGEEALNAGYNEASGGALTSQGL